MASYFDDDEHRDEELERRLIELETRLAYQDDTVLKLQETVRAHQKQLYHMETRFELLLERFRNLRDAGESGNIPNEKPPHY